MFVINILSLVLLILTVSISIHCEGNSSLSIELNTEREEDNATDNIGDKIDSVRGPEKKTEVGMSENLINSSTPVQRNKLSGITNGDTFKLDNNRTLDSSLVLNKLLYNTKETELWINPKDNDNRLGYEIDVSERSFFKSDKNISKEGITNSDRIQKQAIGGIFVDKPVLYRNPILTAVSGRIPAGIKTQTYLPSGQNVPPKVPVNLNRRIVPSHDTHDRPLDRKDLRNESPVQVTAMHSRHSKTLDKNDEELAGSHHHGVETLLMCSTRYKVDISFSSIRSWALECELIFHDISITVLLKSARDRRYELKLNTDKSDYDTLRNEDNISPVCVPSDTFKSVCLYFTESTTLRQPSIVSLHTYLVMNDNWDNTIELGSLDLFLHSKQRKQGKDPKSQLLKQLQVVQPERLALDGNDKQPVVQYWNPSENSAEVVGDYQQHNNGVFDSGYLGNVHDTSFPQSHTHYSPINHNTHDSNYLHNNHKLINHDNTNGAPHHHSNSYYNSIHHDDTHYKYLDNKHDAVHHHSNPHYSDNALESHDSRRSNDNSGTGVHVFPGHNNLANSADTTKTQVKPMLSPPVPETFLNVKYYKRSSDHENINGWIPIKHPMMK